MSYVRFPKKHNIIEMSMSNKTCGRVKEAKLGRAETDLSNPTEL
jgi:hypothetical protein